MNNQIRNSIYDSSLSLLDKRKWKLHRHQDKTSDTASMIPNCPNEVQFAPICISQVPMEQRFSSDEKIAGTIRANGEEV